MNTARENLTTGLISGIDNVSRNIAVLFLIIMIVVILGVLFLVYKFTIGSFGGIGSI